MFKKLSYLARNDRQSVIIIILVIIIAILLIILAGMRSGENKETEQNATQPMTAKDYRGVKAEGYYETEEGQKAELFAFDPNDADSIALARLGLSPRIIQNIYKYRSKGGVFRRTEDFAKLYGLTAGQYRQLAPYIRISDDYRPASEVYGSSERPSFSGGGVTFDDEQHYAQRVNVTPEDSMAHPVKVRQNETINVSTADTTQLCRIPGVGRYFARQVFNYRDRLGGFTSKQQLLEIEGFPESALQHITIDTQAIRKLNINTASNEQLRRHPYIDFRMARDIINYRKTNGPFHNVDELRNARIFGEKRLQALIPYFTF